MEANTDLQNIVTPVKVDVLEQLLKEANYDLGETEFLPNGFRFGFPLFYQGPHDVQQFAPNLKLEYCTKQDLWDKVMR